jgi:leukotriene-A4 hydrolase
MSKRLKKRKGDDMRSINVTRYGSGTFLLLILTLVFISGCAREEPVSQEVDAHTFANVDDVVVTHMDLDLLVNFDDHTLEGRASLHINNLTRAGHFILDTRDLVIERVTLDDGVEETAFTLGESVDHLGQSLIVDINDATNVVHVYYKTSPHAAALQWLEPEQTAGGRHPFLFTQSQAILARTWVPCQDTPGQRITYNARVRVPEGLMAVMSAENAFEKSPDGLYEFSMPQTIPTYLLALSVGDFEFRPLSDRIGVFAEPEIIEEAAWEFADTEDMMRRAEEIYGAYRWGRYDIMVLPPSFPFGGMENARLTFVTPTIIAGDRSLLSLIAHELAHSWAGNLVTMATWNDFWINEGFTSYMTNRIMEAVYGREYAEMLWHLDYQDLIATIDGMGKDNPDTRLHLDLRGRDPDEGMTSIAYIKGSFFLKMLEHNLGRDQFDSFLRRYFDTFAFQTMTAERFLAYLSETILEDQPELERRLKLGNWVYGTGLPENCPRVHSDEFGRVEEQIEAWTTGTAASDLDVRNWTTHHWLHFLMNLPKELTHEHLAELDSVFGFTQSDNSEILNAWLLHAITHRYEEAYPALEEFLLGQGRRKFLMPLYSRLAETPEGMEMALEIYRRARPTYHPISFNSVDEVLNWER